MADVRDHVAAEMENIERTLKEMPTGDSWRRDLLALAADKGVINRETFDALRPFLAFRHFFSHAYALDLQAPRMEALVESVRHTLASFGRDVSNGLSS